jgi:hypothetical protein
MVSCMGAAEAWRQKIKERKFVSFQRGTARG